MDEELLTLLESAPAVLEPDIGTEPEEEEPEPFCSCGRCGEVIEKESDAHRVRVRNSGEPYENWCTDCTDYAAFDPHHTELYSDELWDECYFCCDNCNEIYSRDYYFGDGICEDCAPRDDDEEDDSPLRDYGTRAEKVHGFYGAHRANWSGLYESGYKVHGETLYFGMELEIECLSDAEDLRAAIDRINDLLAGFAILKSDGSLTRGFEIVTAPATMPEFKKRTAKFFAALPELCRQYHLRSWHTSTCGLHVHVSRSALSELQIGKIQAYITDPASYALVRKIAGRDSSRWAGFSEKKYLKDRPLEMGHSAERYTAINLCNAKTIEFRLFKGTTLEAGIFRNLEFVLALAEFTLPGGGMSISESHGGSSFQKFLEQAAQRNTYPNLTRFLTARGFLRGHKRHGNILK